MASTRPGQKKLIKAVMIGDAKAGKTQLLYQLYGKNKPFDKEYKATIGPDFETYEYKDENNKHVASIQCWDTAGQERFQSLGSAFFKGADILICAVDLTAQGGLNAEKLDQTIAEAISHTNNEKVPVLIVGTKVASSKETITITPEALNTYVQEKAESIRQLLPQLMLTDAEKNVGIDELRNAINYATLSANVNLTLRKKVTLDQAIQQLTVSQNPKHNNLAKELTNFRTQIDSVKLDEESKELCQNAVETAVNVLCFQKNAPESQKKSALRNLESAAKLSPSVRKLKLLSVAMMAIGAILAVIGGLTIAASVGAISTGVFAPLGALTLGGGIAMTAGGAALLCIGSGLFADRHRIRNPIDSVKKIENILKNS